MVVLRVESRRVQQPQVLLASLGNAVAPPVGHRRRANAAADTGQVGGTAERANHADGLGLLGVGALPHAPDCRHADRNCKRLVGSADVRSSPAPIVGTPKLARMDKTTFTERIALATEGQPYGFQTHLAKACGIRPSSVNDWLSGQTLTLSTKVLFPAARFLNVNPEWLATGTGVMRPSVGDVKSAVTGSHPVGLEAPTLGKAMRFARLWLTITGDGQPLEKHPDLVLEAARTIETLEANIESEDELAQVMAKLAEMGGANGIKRGTTG